MLYNNIGTITNTINSTKVESRVLYLTNGSDVATIRCRSDGAWLDNLEIRVQLPYTYTGLTTKIWLISDIHAWNATARDTFISAISDIDSNIGVDYVFVLGDLVNTGTSTEFDLYETAKATSNVPSSRWYEIAGNHDDDPSGDFSTFESYFGASRDFKVTIGNIVFICWGGLDEVNAGNHSVTSVSYLETTIENNQSNNIFVLAHHGIYDTTYQTGDSSYWYVKPDADIQAILSSNRVDGWLHGHTHKDADDSLVLFQPLALYESVNLSEGIEFFHCPSATTSAFGTFKFSSRTFGKNVIGNECIDIDEYLVTRFNTGIFFGTSDNINFLDTLTRIVDYKLDLSDSLNIGEDLTKNLSIQLSDVISIISDLSSSQANPKLSDSIDISTMIEINYTEGKTHKSNWKFIIKDNSGNAIASLINARNRWFIQRLNNQSEAGFILDADDDNCNETILNQGINELYIYYKTILMWSGQIVFTRKVAKGDDIYWEVLCKDWVALLSKRFTGVEEIREFTTTDFGEIAWTLIDETQDLANGDFGITLGTIEASITRSPVYDKKNILTAIIEGSNMGNDGSANYGCDFEITPLKVFNVYYPYKGTIKEDVVFRYPDNCENFDALVDSWGIVNQEWGLGKHWTGNTAIVSRADATSQTTYKRREAIKNYSDMSVLAFLQDMVWQDIQWLKDKSKVIKFESRMDNKTKITNYDVGDAVTIICDKFGISEWLWVYERKVEIDDNDKLKISLTVGD